MTRKPATYTTIECLVRDIRRGSQESGVLFLARIIRGMRRDRDAEVRRFRRALRAIVAVPFKCSHAANDNPKSTCRARVRREDWCDKCIAHAALAPRKGRKK